MRFMKILINNFLGLIALTVKIAVIVCMFMAFVIFGVYLLKCYKLVGILIWLLATMFVLAVIISSEEFKEGK